LRALSPAFRRLAQERKVRVTLLIRSRCGWSTRVITSPHRWVRDDCQAWRANVTRYLRRQRDVAAIVTNHRSSTMPGTKAQRGPDTVRAWRPALRRRIPVIAVTDSANWVMTRPSPWDCLRRNPRPRAWRHCADDTSHAMWSGWPAPTVELARTRPGRRAASRIAKRGRYCPQRVCQGATPRGQIMFREGERQSAAYARSLAPCFERRL